MSQGKPEVCTGITARVRSPICASKEAGSRFCVSSSTSAKTGTAPTWSAAVALATKVKAGTITSSPGRTPAALRATSSAAVPLDTATARLAPQNSWSVASRATT